MTNGEAIQGVRKTGHQYYVEVTGYPYGLSDESITVEFADTIEEQHLKEVKAQIIPVVDELRGYVRHPDWGKENRPVLLFVLDGRRAVNKLHTLREEKDHYPRVFTYNFVPAGFGLLREPTFGFLKQPMPTTHDHNNG